MNGLSNLYNYTYNYFKLNSSTIVGLHFDAYKKNQTLGPAITLRADGQPEFKSISLQNFELQPGMEVAWLDCNLIKKILPSMLSTMGFDEKQLPSFNESDRPSIWKCDGRIRVKDSTILVNSFTTQNIWNYQIDEILDEKGVSKLFREKIGPICETNGQSMTCPLRSSESEQTYYSSTSSFPAIKAAKEGNVPSCVNKYSWLPNLNPDPYLLCGLGLILVSLVGCERIARLNYKREDEQHSRWSMLSTTQKTGAIALAVIPLALSFACRVANTGF